MTGVRNKGVRGIKEEEPLFVVPVALAYDTGGRKSIEALTIAGQTYTTGSGGTPEPDKGTR